MTKIEHYGRFLAFAALLAAVWFLMRGYQGLTGDAQIYAFQALARVHPHLAADLYLQNTSQDRFTVFSPLYAFFIRRLGLEDAARLLTLTATIWLLAAAWSFAGALVDSTLAWLGAAFLLILPTDFGAAGVFHFFEPFLTARLPAEALAVTALSCHFRGKRLLALILAGAALLVHPLMALPICMLLVSLRLAYRAIVGWAVAASFATVCIAGAVSYFSIMPHSIPVMDDEWLNVVRERSQFLFLQLWSVHDWDLNVRLLLYAAFAALVMQDERIVKLSLHAALLGLTGLVVALVAGTVGPVALLVQGQAWRWVWLAGLVDIVLLPAIALGVWRDDKCGPLCATVLVGGWAIFHSAAPVALALSLWLLRPHIGLKAAIVFRWLAVIAGLIVLAWIAEKSWALLAGPLSAGEQLREIFSLKIPALLAVILSWKLLRSSRSMWAPVLAGLVALALIAPVARLAFKQRGVLDSPADIREFAEWADAIPPTSTVLIVPERDVGGFVWFTLDRPNYLSIDQSAGVVFSRATALEVERRSRNLLPLMSPNWKIRTRLRAAEPAPGPPKAAPGLTREALVSVCRDPALGFVASPQNIGFDPLPQQKSGAWKGWNLYDCRHVHDSAGS